MQIQNILMFPNPVFNKWFPMGNKFDLSRECHAIGDAHGDNEQL